MLGSQRKQEFPPWEEPRQELYFSATYPGTKQIVARPLHCPKLFGRRFRAVHKDEPGDKLAN